MTLKINTKGAQKKIEREAKKIGKKAKSQIASVMNKETRAARREIVDSLITKTGLKRKVLNDRFSITRANPAKELKTAITPLYGKRLYMMNYPWAKAIARGGKAVIRLLSPIYRKNMRTGFLSKDGTRMYLRPESEFTGEPARTVVAVKGRSVPRLFSEMKIKELYQEKLTERILKAIKGMWRK